MLATEDKGGISLSPSNSCIFFFSFFVSGGQNVCGGAFFGGKKQL